MQAVTDDATLEIVVDVVDRRVAVPALDLDEPFELDDHTHHRLLNGLDDIGLTEQKAAEIDAFEARRPSFKPTAAAS
jgi:3-isopropylmalate/(R)-2-methylmalate dehydratase small subunit